MRYAAVLLFASSLATQAQATEPDLYSQFIAAFARNDVARLYTIARSTSDGHLAKRQLGMLVVAGARLRSEDMQGCLAALDSLDGTGSIADRKVFAMACQLRAQVMDWAGHYEEGTRSVVRGLGAADSVSAPQERVTLLVVGAEILLSLESYEAAAEQLLRAERLAHRIGFTRGQAMARIDLGTIRFYQKRYDEAVADFEETVRLSAENGWSVLLENGAFNLASTLIMRQRSADALRIFESQLRRSGVAPLSRAQLFSHLGRTQSDLGHHRQAAISLRKALAICDSLDDRKESIKTEQLLARVEWQLGERDSAVARLTRLVKSAKEQRMMRAVSEMQMQLHDWQKAVGNIAGSLELLEHYTELYDSLSRATYHGQLARSEVLMETERKERRIAEQQQALDLAASEDRRKSLQRNILIGVAAFAALVAGLLWRLARSRRQRLEKEKELHEKAVDELLQKNELTALHAMFEGQEKERDRVARDLHDRVGSMLGNVKMQMEVLEERMDTDQQEREGQYKKVYGLLVETVGEVRRISHDMVAGTLARFGLEKALEGLCDSVRVTGRLAVELRVFGLENRLERGMEITVYRIVQELVGNALKHAKASELSIDVTRTPGRLSVIVSDNGVGFDTAVPSEGMGLANVRKRAATVGGALTIDSTPGKGTTVSVECAVVE